jgi:hypothetical protein
MNLQDALTTRNNLRDVLAMSLTEDKPNHGICWYLDVGEDWARDTFKRWPQFSGDVYYPVPHPSKSSALAFDCNFDDNTLWEGAYGDSRRDLCVFLLDNIEALIRKTKKLDSYLQAMRLRKAARKVLILAKAGKVTEPKAGICSQPELAGLDFHDYVQGWQHFNGCTRYFIPSPNKRFSDNIDAFFRLSKWEGEYGALRMDFLQHVIDSTTKELNNIELVPYESKN